MRFTEGYVAGAPILREAVAAFERETSLPWHDARWLWLASWVALDLWDDAACTVLLARQLELVRASGALTDLTLVLTVQSIVDALLGDLTSAASPEKDLRAAVEATGIAEPPYSSLGNAAWRGSEAELSALTESLASDAALRGEGFAGAMIEYLRGVLYNGLGRYDAALAAVRGAESLDDETSATWSLIELIEAAARSGQARVAARALERLAATTRAGGTPWGLGVEARCRALLSDGEVAETLYREAIDLLGRTRVRVQLARTHLLYGEWLRREARRVAAREQLRAALEMFTSTGNEAFADRAARELLATGERVRKRTNVTREELTPQEAQIARLVGDGLSNAEIAARLFISPHTVAYHLRKVFSKLNVSSRNQLSQILPGSASDAHR